MKGIISYISIFVILTTISLLIKNSNCEKTTNSMFGNENAKQIFNSMGLDKKTELTNKEVELFFYRIISKDSQENKMFYESISSKLSKKLPAVIPRADVANHLTKDNMMKSIEETVEELYGIEYVAGVRDQFSKIFDDVKAEQDESESVNKEEEAKEANTNIDDL